MNPFARHLASVLVGLTLTGGAAFGQTPQVKVPFPTDAKIGFVNPQYVFTMSREGKEAANQLKALQSKKQADISAKTKEVEALQLQLSKNVAVLNEEARVRLERDVARAKVDFQRLVEDSEAEVQEMQQQFQRAFSRKLFPAIGEVAKARDLWAVFSTAESNLLWHLPALDISDEIVTRLDTPAAPSPVR
jgi:outer membrane protein